ncbi:MAG: DUF501 domain-containing protein [Candidatus Riflebacteria bacterium]|nr:DUF501 domain-containing protein [Candidatus Riflebacteria bacterium]
MKGRLQGVDTRQSDRRPSAFNLLDPGPERPGREPAGPTAGALLIGGQPRGLAPEDREFVEQSLGQLRYEPLGVLDRCARGHPRVILGFYGPGPSSEPPARAQEPVISVTAFWLVCPWLRSAVSRLEAAGAIDRIEAMLRADPALRQAFAHAQRLYRRLLYRLFRAELPAVDPGPYLARVRGVAGVADEHYVKCLHAQTAFTLATGRGPAGAVALTELALTRSPDGRWRGGCRG